MSPLLIGFGGLALLGALGVVACRRTVHAALSLVGNVASLAVLYLLLNAQFLFAVQLIIYAGAVVVLFIFIIALLNPEHEERPVLDRRLLVGVAATVLITGGMVLLASNGVTSNRHGLRGAQVGAAAAPDECQPEAPTACHDPYQGFAFDPDSVNRAGNVQTTGVQLFTTFMLPFELTSLLLLVAAIGAVHLTRRAPSAARPGVSRRRSGRPPAWLGGWSPTDPRLRDLPPAGVPAEPAGRGAAGGGA